MSVTSAIRQMLAAGLSIEQALTAAEIMEANELAKADDALVRRRASDAERQRRRRERQGHNVTSRDNVTGVTVSSPPSSNGFPPHPLSLTTSSPSSGGGESRDALGWPVAVSDWVEVLVAETGCADIHRDLWPRKCATVLVGWHETDRFEWRDVVAGIQAALVGRQNDPPSSWKYFAGSIARAKANRTAKTPESQAHERRSQSYQTAAERNQDSTIAAFQAVFRGSSDGQVEPVNAA